MTFPERKSKGQEGRSRDRNRRSRQDRRGGCWRHARQPEAKVGIQRRHNLSIHGVVDDVGTVKSERTTLKVQSVLRERVTSPWRQRWGRVTWSCRAALESQRSQGSPWKHKEAERNSRQYMRETIIRSHISIITRIHFPDALPGRIKLPFLQHKCHRLPKSVVQFS